MDNIATHVALPSKAVGIPTTQGAWNWISPLSTRAQTQWRGGKDVYLFYCLYKQVETSSSIFAGQTLFNLSDVLTLNCVPFYPHGSNEYVFWATSSAEVVELYPRWLLEAKQSRDPLSLKQLSLIVAELTNALYAADIEGINRGLSVAAPEEMSIDAIVAIARVTYAARKKLSSWSSFVARASKDLEVRGAGSAALKGLL